MTDQNVEEQIEKLRNQGHLKKFYPYLYNHTLLSEGSNGIVHLLIAWWITNMTMLSN